MLSKLNSIASDLLGLHGYPTQTTAGWQIFTPRKLNAAAGSKLASPGKARDSRADLRKAGCAGTPVTGSARG